MQQPTFTDLLARSFDLLPPGAQDRVKALLYDEGLLYDQEEYHKKRGQDLDLEPERRGIHREIVTLIRQCSPRTLTAFSYYGGKTPHLQFLLPLLPASAVYCEPYAGGGSVLLNRQPSRKEVYNDLDEDLVNFFEVLRDSPDDLIHKLYLTPYSRREFQRAFF